MEIGFDVEFGAMAVNIELSYKQNAVKCLFGIEPYPLT